jgi:hypothetical protein
VSPSDSSDLVHDHQTTPRPPFPRPRRPPHRHAGPTVSADLDLGTSTRSTASDTLGVLPSPAPLYIVGFVVRAGWRFDVAPVWFLPEIGVSVHPPQSGRVPMALTLPAVADPWLSYGIHAGWLFW